MYDYLDLLSLPDHERRHLLAYPIAWLDSLLLRPDIKVRTSVPLGVYVYESFTYRCVFTKLIYIQYSTSVSPIAYFINPSFLL